MQKNNKRNKRISSRLITLGLFVFFLIGITIVAYPYISDRLAKSNSIKAIEEYRNYTLTLSKDELQREWDKARVYNENLAGDPVHDPFVPDSGMALPENYMSVLNVKGDGVMGYLEVPSVDIQLLIGHGTSDEVLDTYVGHIEQTALPIGGEHTHSVLTAHTGLPTAKLFSDLVKVKEGDHFYIYILDEKLSYKVDQIEVILPEEVEKLEMIPGKDYVTLLTCTPYGVNSHRLLVRGVRVPNEELEDLQAWKTDLIIVIIWTLLMLLVFIIVRTISKKRYHNSLK